MKKLVLVFLFIGFYTFGYNQVIRGTILDEITKDTICFASIYFNGTFVGTSSDINGYFELNVSKNISMPLTISAVGYYSYTLTDYSNTKPFLIYLKPKVYELKDVVIKANSLAKKRKRNLLVFKAEFLGTTANARQCEIINEKDITFNYDSDDDTLKAFALKPILIDNRALGYKITYYLDKFEYYKKSGATFFSGNIIFKEDISTEETQKQFNVSREYAYLGSRMHFFRALWSDKLKSDGFTVTNSVNDILLSKDILIRDFKNNKFLTYPENLRIGYNIGGSYIVFLKRLVYFDQTGYFDPLGINWKGEMAEQRIADWLPYEYGIE
ncbi:MAG: carboxypeptidase-like regulatory domain-containing protein [Lentimicrobiaceae bacterium]|jgi:hypothetical protein